MTKIILTTTEHNQARADVNAIKSMLQCYAASHPKKHRITVAATLFVPSVVIFALGYGFMADGDSLTGAVVTLAGSLLFFGSAGRAGLLKPEWRGDEISLTDLNKVRGFSPSVKKLISENMEKAEGALTYSQLEILLPEAEAWLKEDEIRLSIEQQLNSKNSHSVAT